MSHDIPTAHAQVVGSQIQVHGHISFIGNNAEAHVGGALYIQAFGQIKVYTGSQIDFINNTGRLAINTAIGVI